MLRRLTIRDFVIVDRLELDFSAGFGALTGETGAGKSILLDALSLLLGGRSDAGVVRSGCQRAELQAEFDLPTENPAALWLEDNAIELEDGLILLRRVIDANGRSRAQVNGVTVTSAQLKAIGELLADIHGQHAHHALLRSDAQRDLLDSHARLNPLVQDVSIRYREWQLAISAQRDAEQHFAERSRELELLGWQLKELQELGLAEGEWESLQQEHARLAHAASLLEGAGESLASLHEGDYPLAGELDRVVSRLDELAEYDAGLGEIRDLLNGASIQLSEAVQQLRRYRDRLEIDPERLSELEARIGKVTELSRKHRCAPDELPGKTLELQSATQRLEQLADAQALAAAVTERRDAYRDVAEQLSQERQKAARTLSDNVTQAMQDLALGGGQFEIALLPESEGSLYGLERIEFQVATNAGQPLRPMGKVASGGELSRIGLAIQVLTSRVPPIPTLIFDEVDVGIGGRVAEIVGKLLRQLGQECQVLCVTHLPQVAAQANWQWNIAKETRQGQTLSRVTPLDAAEQRVEEIARMLGGVAITDRTREHARELLGYTAA